LPDEERLLGLFFLALLLAELRLCVDELRDGEAFAEPLRPVLLRLLVVSLLAMMTP
jgi:hypothetical protein